MLRLKSELMQNRNFLNEHSFTKKDLILICQQYKIKVSAQQMKDAIINVLVKGILDSVSFFIKKCDIERFRHLFGFFHDFFSYGNTFFLF
jgi:hypothetical protein